MLVEGRDALAYPPPRNGSARNWVTRRTPAWRKWKSPPATPSRAQLAAQELADALHGAGATAQEVLGPAASPVARLRGVYPYHLFLRARDDARLAQLLATIDRSVKARVRVDVNPRGGL